MSSSKKRVMRARGTGTSRAALVTEITPGPASLPLDESTPAEEPGISLGGSACSDRGRDTVKVDPRPGSLVTPTEPPCASTTALTRLSPRPRPRSARLVSPRNSRSQMRGNSSGGIPDPVSRTRSTARSPSRCTSTSICPSGGRVFDRVVKEIGPHLLEPHAIPMDHDIGADVGDEADAFGLRHLPV